jgi:hypothetical protein
LTVRLERENGNLPPPSPHAHQFFPATSFIDLEITLGN